MPPDDAKPRPPRPVTAAYLERAALAYHERYASSSENLRRTCWAACWPRSAGFSGRC